MNTWAAPGVKCVCINDQLSDKQSGTPNDYVVKDNIYTIVEVFERAGLVLLGLWGMPLGTSFVVTAFRPLAYPPQSLEHDVGVFNRIARHTSSPVEEDV